MTKEELEERQSWSLNQKIDHALGTIEVFVNRMGGLDKVYVAFSGGKDSTVLLHLARTLYPDIKVMFLNTGNEYPEIIRFVNQVKEHVNLDIVRPKYTPRQVWAKYGFPLVSKEESQYIHEVRINPTSATAQKRMGGDKYAISKQWRFLVDEPYETSHMCCAKLKKEPAKRYQKETGRYPILGTMASESRLRKSSYLRNGGCNVYDGKKPSSRPLSIWTDEDIWEYIRINNLEIAEIYHKGADRTGCMGCGFGCHFKDDVRFDLLYKIHPKCYEMVMNYTNNGVCFKDAVRKVMAVNNQLLPDERKWKKKITKK